MPYLASPAKEIPKKDNEDRILLNPISKLNNKPLIESEADSIDLSNLEEKYNIINISDNREPAPNPKTLGTTYKYSKDITLA